ncbi:MAG TPA: hypothetical protein VL854_12055 [Nitrososphaeraceae archaeon]|nr:hypothetical protein [Nitrososphaeraceae archaeon]
MPWRIYPMKQKYTKKDGTISVYLLKNKKWIDCNKPYKPQKRGLEKKTILSNRFGLLELYSRKEQQQLMCPSGYSISQCFNILKKMWFAYHKARDYDRNIETMEKYAKAIQAVQKDMGIKTTSFPHIGLYGDVLILNNKKGERIVSEDHSELKRKQDEYDKWQAENSRKIQKKVLKPDKEKGEVIESSVDESFSEKYEDDRDYLIPDVLEANEEEGEKVITIPDNIPFRKRINNALIPDEEKGEKVITIPDNIPFRKRIKN